MPTVERNIVRLDGKNGVMFVVSGLRGGKNIYMGSFVKIESARIARGMMDEKFPANRNGNKRSDEEKLELLTKKLGLQDR